MSPTRKSGRTRPAATATLRFGSAGTTIASSSPDSGASMQVSRLGDWAGSMPAARPRPSLGPLQPHLERVGGGSLQPSRLR